MPFDVGKPVERVYFNDMKTFLRYITPKRFELLGRLHQSGTMDIVSDGLPLSLPL